MKRRFLSTFLSLCLVLGLLPTAAFAQGESYVALGDSITYGVGLSGDEQAFPEIIAEKYEYELENLAVSGATSGDLLAVVENPDNADILANADVITITIGGNDLMGALYQYLANEYNSTYDPDITAEDLQKALAGEEGAPVEQMTMLTFAVGVIGGFADSNAAGDALTQFGTNLKDIITTLKEINNDVTIIVANQYNPYSYAADEATGIAAFWASTVEAAFEAGVKALNEVIEAGAAYYEVADVYTEFKSAESNPCNASFSTMNLDFHPNAYGHELIAEVISGLLADWTPPEEPQSPAEKLWVNGVDMLEDEDSTVTCGSGTAVYDATTNTLTLNSATITEVYTYKSEDAYFSYTSGIDVVGDLTIVLEGDNTISGEEFGEEISYGIHSSGPITIESNSSGSLTIEAVGTGIYSDVADIHYSRITLQNVNCGLTASELNIENSTVIIDNTGLTSIQANAVTIDDSTVNITAEGYILSNSSNGSLTIKGDQSNVTMVSEATFALFLKTVTIEGGTVSITNNASIGVYVDEAFTVTGTPTVTVTGSAGAFFSRTSTITVRGVQYNSSGTTVEIVDGQVESGLRIPGGVIVNGEPLESGETVTFSDGGTAEYDAATNTLTLNDANISSGYSVYSYICGIYTDGDKDLTIILNGENTINNVDYGIYSTVGGITIGGEGSLEIRSSYTGIDAMSALVINNGTLNITVADKENGQTNREVSGISCGFNGLTVNGGNITIDISSKFSWGGNGLSSSGVVTVAGGSVKITAREKSRGIYSTQNCEFTGGTVEVNSISGAGILAEENVIISGSPTISATVAEGNAAIDGHIEKDGQVYICTGSEVSIEAGQIKAGLSLYVPEEPDRPSGNKDDDHDTGSTTESERNPDGSITTTVTKPDGTTVETTRNPDGSKEVVETKKDGTIVTTATDKSGNETMTTENPDGTSVVAITRTDGSTSATTVDEDGLSVTVAALSDSAIAQGQTGTVSLPMPSVAAASDLDSAPAVMLDLPADTAVKVEIPVENVTAGTVAVLEKADGTSEIVKTSVTTTNGVVLTLSAGETVKILDNTKTFADVADTFWGADAVAFASSRELFNGTSATAFSPNAPMNRAMIVTVLARLDGVDTTTGSAWYEAGAQWAMASGISDGSGLDQNLTREQLATMLYRYAQYKGYDVSVGENTNILSYPDFSTVSEYAVEALQWACGAGIISGKDGLLDPAGSATRAEVATMLMRFCQQSVS